MRKYMLAAFLAVFVFAFLPSMQAQAQSSDGFELDGTGTVTLRSQHAAKEKVSSLQFSLTVESAEAVQVDFEFGQNNARIAEFRYDENEKKLNIYMAGVDALFAENTDALTIGKVIIRNGSGEEAAAKVSVVEDSLQYVYGTELKQMDDVEIPAAVQLGEVPQETPPPVNTPEPVQTPDPGAQETPNPGPQQTPDPGTQNPPDSGNQDDDDDPNDGWNPGWEESNNNSNGTSQSSGNNRKPSKTQVASMYKVFLLFSEFLRSLLTPPKMEDEVISIFTSLSTIILTPPKILLALTTASCLIFAPLRSSSIAPNTASSRQP